MITTVRRFASRAVYGDEDEHGVDTNSVELFARADAARTEAIEAGGSGRLAPGSERSDSMLMISTRTEEESVRRMRSIPAPPAGGGGPDPQLSQFASWIGESLSRQANKRMRRLVGQSWLTNRFGDASVEEAFAAYLMHHQLKYVQRVLLIAGSLLVVALIYQARQPQSPSRRRPRAAVTRASAATCRHPSGDHPPVGSPSPPPGRRPCCSGSNTTTAARAACCRAASP